MAALTGAPGIGKSALGQTLLKDAGQAVVVRCETDADAFLRTLAQALNPDAPPTPAFAPLLVQAEATHQTVFLEDLHRLPEDDAAGILRLLAAQARRSRWLLTSRSRLPELALQEQCLRLGPLEDAAARELAKQCLHAPSAHTDAPGIDELLAAAGGWPLWIRRLALTPAQETDPLDGLSDAAIRNLALTALLKESSDIPAAFETLPSQVPETATEAPATENAPRDDDPAQTQRLERLREHLHSDNPMSAALLLPDLQATQRAWSLVEHESAPALQPAKRVFALRVATRPSLDWLANAPSQTPEEHAQRAQAMLLRGAPRDALGLLRRHTPWALPGARPVSDDQRRVLTRLRLAYAEALYETGDADKAIPLLATSSPGNIAEDVHRRLLWAQALCHNGRSQEAKAQLNTAEALFDALETEESTTLDGIRTGLRLQLGLTEIPPGYENLDEPQPPAKRSLGVQSLVFRGFRMAAGGQFAIAKELLDGLWGRGTLPRGSGVLANIAQGLLGITQGRYTGLDALSQELLREAEALRHASLYHWAFMFERLVNLSQTMERPELPWPAHIPPPQGIAARYLQTLRVVHRARRGEFVPEAETPRPGRGDGPLVRCVCDTAAAYLHLLGDRPQEVIAVAEAGYERVRRGRFLFLEGEILLPLVFVRLQRYRQGADDAAELRRALAKLRATARRLRSRRYAAMATLVETAFDASPPVATLLSLANDPAASPTVARVAAALLGAPAEGDALDAFLRTHLRGDSPAQSHQGWAHECAPVLQPPHWFIDLDRGAAHLPSDQKSGRTQPLSPQSLRLLEQLFLAEEHFLSLEELALRAWDLDDFHPLRDSKRIHVAVRRTRKLLEELPSKPERLLTDGDGYRLAPGAGLLRPRAPRQ